ncbi:nitronate monooxygenase [bacterium]|nr:nitronate monooxygenase [bacterium]MBU1063958.1 nitronate monooxygenase [bacterium]MBU1872728.1 nitronate monooxygenase [bacterium]
MFGNMPELQIGHLRAKTPVIQGGMGVGISLSGLASAVANEGGIGIIAAVGIGMNGGKISGDFSEANAEALRQEIRTARSKTDGLIGVNVMIALTDANRLLEVSVEEEVDVAIMGAGLPLKLPVSIVETGLKNIHTRFIPIVSSGRAAELIFNHWAKKYSHIPDAVIVEGPLAGGHLGFKAAELTQASNTLENLVSDVISAIRPFEQQFQQPIPVIAAGGIYTGSDIYKFLQLGASGVQMATRFVTTHECDADIRFKEMYLDCRESDLRIIDSPVGLPGRAINNPFLESVSAGEKKPFKCPWKCLRTCNFEKVPYCIAKALIFAQKGKFHYGFAFAGSNAWRADKIISVQELMDTLKKEYQCESRTMRLDNVQTQPNFVYDYI